MVSIEELLNKEQLKEIYSCANVHEYVFKCLTYEDIPQIINGEISYDNGKYGWNWYVLPLPNGKYATYNATDSKRADTIKKMIDYCSRDNQFGKSKENMESFIRFKLQSKDEAEEWLLGKAICLLLDNKGYKTEMWSQLGGIGGIAATKGGKVIRIVGAYPTKKDLIHILETITKIEI